MAEANKANVKPKFIIVIGASAGGLSALVELVGQFDQSLDAAIFIVLHLSRKGIGDFLVHRLQQFTSLPCIIGKDSLTIEKGHIYIAPPNYHLLVKDNHMLIGHGPEENRWRPSIDVLFRSAAATYGGHVIGVILTGLLDDGTSGMLAIKRSGGRCVVQDPDEAEYPDMPVSVLNIMEVDACTRVADMGKLLTKMTSDNDVNQIPIPDDLKAEAEIAERVATGIDGVMAIGEETIFSCPDCGGGLWKITNGNVEHYRCHIGHAYSERDLLVKQSEQVEGTLWIALRIMEERRNLLKRMETENLQRGFKRLASENGKKAIELEHHITKLKGLLFETQENESSN